jgi:hypothetical protein
MPFCAGCRAPQIRFIPPEPVEAPVRADVALEALPAATALVWRPALRAALIGGVFSFFSLGLPRGLLGFGFMVGGTLAVYAYRRRLPGAVLNLGSGTLLGAASGLCGFLISSVRVAVKLLLLHEGAELRQTTFANMDRVIQNTDPELQQSMAGIFQHFRTPEGFLYLVAIGALCMCLMFIFFSILGGAIGANITRRNPK